MKCAMMLLLLFPAAAVAQTKQETADWITSKTNATFNEGLSYQVDDDSLIVKLRSPGLYGGSQERTMPIRSIAQISYLHTDEFLSVRLTCLDKCAHVAGFDDSGKFLSDGYSDTFLVEIYGKVDADLPERMQKAILHLVSLHGGQAKIVPHRKLKETF